MQFMRYALDRHIRIDEISFYFGNDLLVQNLFGRQLQIFPAQFIKVRSGDGKPAGVKLHFTYFTAVLRY